jgi:hypothetical protein
MNNRSLFFKTLLILRELFPFKFWKFIDKICADIVGPYYMTETINFLFCICVCFVFCHVLYWFTFLLFFVLYRNSFQRAFYMEGKAA